MVVFRHDVVEEDDKNCLAVDWLIIGGCCRPGHREEQIICGHQSHFKLELAKMEERSKKLSKHSGH